MDPHHERRIVALALARGLITRDQLDRHGPDGSAAETHAEGASDRGPLLDALIRAGVLDEDTVAAVAEAAQPGRRRSVTLRHGRTAML